MIVKLLTEHHLEFISLKGGYRGSSASTLVKMSNLTNLCRGSYIIGLWLWNFETIRGSLMTPKRQKLASLAQEICTL